MRAVKQGRVFTLFQEPSSKHKDSGEIGFRQKPHATHLVFPKPLAEARGVKVIGIKYDLIREPDIQDAISTKAMKKLPPKKRRTAEEKLEKIPKFNIRVRRTATIETSISVEGKTKAEARQRAVHIAEGQEFDPSKAVIKMEVR